MPPDKNRQPVGANEVLFYWPEFEAFAKRLGICVNKYTKTLTIILNLDDAAIVEHTYYGDKEKTPAATDNRRSDQRGAYGRDGLGG
jgi:hypothetical protein